MQTKKQVSLKQAFVLEWNDLAVFDELVRDGRQNSYEIRANCADGATRTFTSLKEIEEYDNSISKAIQTLKLQATGNTYADRASINFSDGSLFNVDFEAAGEDKAVTEFVSAVQERIREMRPWYALFPEFGWLNGVLIVVGGTLGLYAMYRLVSGTATKFSNLGLVALGLSWVGLLLDKIKEKLFPQSVIALGATQRMHKKKEILRVGVVLAFIVNVVAGLVVAAIYA
jgi:hypothetical protein